MSHIDWIDDLIARNPFECVMWPFAPGSDGYGRIYYAGKIHQANRFICERVHGVPPTSQHLAAHACFKVGCVTPCHLIWKTPQENMHDKYVAGTMSFNERSGTSKLTNDDVSLIREWRGQYSQESIARHFGITQSAVSKIQLRRSWQG